MIEKLRRTLAPWRNEWARRSKETLQSGVWIAPGLACVGLAGAAHFVLAELIHDFAPSILYNTAIFCVAVWAGIPAGLVALGLSTLLMLLMLLGLNAFGLGSDIQAAPQAIDLTIFALAAILIVWIGGRYRALSVPCLQRGNEYRSGSGLFLKLHRFLLEGVPPNSFSAYIFAVLCIGVATLIRSGFAVSSGNIMPLVSYYPAVLLSALIGGAGAGYLQSWPVSLPFGRNIPVRSFLPAYPLVTRASALPFTSSAPCFQCGLQRTIGPAFTAGLHNSPARWKRSRQF